jgi:hypothetical protein
MFLSKEEIIQLTGYKFPKKQAEFLRSRGYVFEVDCYGNPIILRSYLEQILGGTKLRSTRKTEPDIAALRALMSVTKNKKKNCNE